MEIVKETPEERFQKINEAMSKHCFEAGRLRFNLELEEEALEKKRLQYKNMRQDFDKLNKEHRKASEEYFFAKNQGKEKEAPLEQPTVTQ